MRAVLRLSDAQQAHRAILALWADMKPWLMAGHRLEVTVRKERRSTQANARMWAMLSDVAEQVVWHGKKLSPADWKCVFTASLKRQDVVPGIDGGFVVIGAYTSTMTVAEHCALMELIEAFGAQQGVRFTTQELEPA